MKSGILSNSDSNLAIYRDARKSLSHEERQSFNSYFIGALSVGAPEKLWKEAVETAERCIAGDRQRATERDEPLRVTETADTLPSPVSGGGPVGSSPESANENLKGKGTHL